ncbi:MAG: radical SAM protein [Prevotellaceae bacterium]|jgi:MoaA/NifB/PqqE/SkfB family radical SAM enzyme|nr:radical SAM protein [Prevotellaceae bacterium]
MKFLYLPLWFFKTRILGKKIPLQSVIFITDKCNLRCKHCSIYSTKNTLTKKYKQIKKELEYCYQLGSRFVDFEGGEPILWRDGDKDLNSLLDLAREIGFFSVTITTNGQQPFSHVRANSIWVSVDGFEEYHDEIRGKHTFERLVHNINESTHPHISINMVVNCLNYKAVEQTIEFAKQNQNIEMISINFHTPYKNTEYLRLEMEQRAEVIDKVIAYKRKGYPIMNSISGLKKMKTLDFKKYCWISNFIHVNGQKTVDCGGSKLGLCDECGFSMAGEMNALMNLKPDTIFAGMRLRM